MNEVAYNLARAAHEIVQTAKYRSEVELKARATQLKLEVRKPSAAELAWAVATLGAKGAGQPKPSRPVIYAREAQGLANYPDTVPITLQALHIGELTIAAAPCEVFAKTGLAIKSGSVAKSTFTIELANGYGGYLPPPEQHEYGGYETWPARSSFLEVQAEPKIRDGLLGLIKAVNAD